MEVLIIGGVILLFIVLFLVSWLNEKKRTETFKAMAAQMGFEFYEKDDMLHVSLGNFKLFSSGHSQRTKNVFKGTREDVSVLIADYAYTTGHGKNTTTHQQTICIIDDPEMKVPHFFLRHENKFFDFLGKVFGGQDINFDDDPQFSDAFVLQGESESMTRELFSSDIRRGFVKFAGTNSQIEGRGPRILLHNGKRTKPEQITRLLKDTFDVYNLLKTSPQSLPNSHNNH